MKMINSISIKHFKPFIDVTVPLSGLTYVYGENGIGKSSIAQAVLLLKQTFSEDEPSRLLLNGKYVRIGNGIDALNRDAESDDLSLGICFKDGKNISIKADYIADTDQLPLTIEDRSGTKLINNQNIIFLSANRVGPQLISPFSSTDVAAKEMSEGGQNAYALLHTYGSESFSTDDPRVVKEARSLTISANFNSYMSMISSGSSINIQSIRSIDSVSSTFRFDGNGLSKAEIRPTNVGYGLSYSSSVIIACLLASPGDILIIENPEAHLHTKGQRAIALLLARTAASGVQVICETHSRELFYESRKLIAAGEIDEEQVSLVYVSNSEGRRIAAIWQPITRPFSELTVGFDDFIEMFGGPMDFVAR